MKITNLFFNVSESLVLESGEVLENAVIAYKTYGKLNPNKSNAILICHALTGHAHVCSDQEDSYDGWWEQMVGPGKYIDTNSFYVICSNILGSCKGSTGPSSINPNTQSIYGLSLPVITVKDMVNAQKKLIESLEIQTLHAIIGPSMGGMQALQWAINYPSSLKLCCCIATASSLSPQALAFGAVGRHAITSDPYWEKGNYKEHFPKEGLAIARMIGHITYLSQQSLDSKFGRKLQEKESYGFDFKTDFQVESYLRYQGDKFVDQFDANTYLYLSKALSYFDLSREYNSLESALDKINADMLLLSISSDWLYPTEQSKKIARTLMRLNKRVSFCEIESDYGHDAFLIECEKFGNMIQSFLEKQ